MPQYKFAAVLKGNATLFYPLTTDFQFSTNQVIAQKKRTKERYPSHKSKDTNKKR